MKIKLTSVMVDDQAKALAFYTEKLGFVAKHDIPMGEFRWLTVVAPDEPEGTELLLEPMAHLASRDYQTFLKGERIPAAAFFVDDLDAEHARLAALGVVFATPPTEIPGGPKIAVLDDTCGNLIQLVQTSEGAA